jgi:site-specific DNA-cytosine methylase
LNVLSLFDGISCGRVALDRAGISVDTYYASEIDKHAMTIAQKNWPDTIQVGDITKLKADDLPKIDLMMGGSPCQGFSLVGKQLNFDDPRSKLFFEFVRLMVEIRPTYYLLENVKMNKQFQRVVSEYLGVEPIMIDSARVSAQRRERLYWTNIPNVTIPDHRNILFEHQVWRRPHGWFKEYAGPVDKFFTITTRVANDYKIILPDGARRFITPEECEALQTLPEGYTAGISPTQRYKCLGNGWTVDVIAHILSHIPKEVAYAREQLHEVSST